MPTAIEAIQAIASRQDVRAVYGPPTRQAFQRRAAEPAETEDTPSVFTDPETDGGEVRETDDIRQVVDNANLQLGLQNRALRFRIDSENDVVQIQVVDKDRERVIRSIPSDEMLRLASRMRELSGLGAMVDQSR